MIPLEILFSYGALTLLFVWLFVVAMVFLFVFVLLMPIIRGAPFLPSSKKAIEKMIEFSSVKSGEKMADIGSGDGRIVIAFARSGAEAHGFEINPVLVLISQYRIWKEGLWGRAYIHWKSFWRKDFSSFDIVTVFGISHIMGDLEKKLKKELKPGARVLANTFPFLTWSSERSDDDVYLYRQQ